MFVIGYDNCMMGVPKMGRVIVVVEVMFVLVIYKYDDVEMSKCWSKRTINMLMSCVVLL